jgi:choice-of-anchor A domain-containing protein
MQSAVSWRNLACTALLIGAAVVARGQTAATDLLNFANDTKGYNLLTLGNATLNGSSDTHGSIAIGGNLTFGGTWDIAEDAVSNSEPALYVNGTMTLNGTEQLENGYAATPNASGTWNSGSKNFTESSGTLHINSSTSSYDNTSPLTNPTPAGWNWSTESSSLTSISSNLAGQTVSSSGSIVVNGQTLNFDTTQTSGTVVFDIDASCLQDGTYNGTAFSGIQVSVPTGVNYVINVTGVTNGEAIFGSGVNVNAGSNDDQLLWNFDESTNMTVSVGGNFYGSILAPNVNITDDTTIDGTVVADNFTDNGVELHDDDAFVDVNVPEPRTFALWAVGLCGAMILVGRRLRRPAKNAA